MHAAAFSSEASDFSDLLNDLFVIDPVALTSTDLSHVRHGEPPIPRLYFGYTAAGGKLFVFGGIFGSGNTFPRMQIA